MSNSSDVKRVKQWGKVSDLRALLPFTLLEMFNWSSVVDLGSGDCGQEHICLLHHRGLLRKSEEAVVPTGPRTTIDYCWIILRCLKIKWVVYCHYWNRLLEISVCPKLGHTHMDTHTYPAFLGLASPVAEHKQSYFLVCGKLSVLCTRPGKECLSFSLHLLKASIPLSNIGNFLKSI